MNIERNTSLIESLSITTSAATTPEVPVGAKSSGEVFMPAGGSVNTLTFHAAPKLGGTFLPAYDSAASPAAVTLAVTAGRAYMLPSPLFGAAAIKIVGDAAGTIHLNLKS